ncbi:hypothetical protein [Acinetobacter calcoaceticus]|uniref:hypothetical protein n=1 Tax=Acinetobacter calcoaceticus TaxID=471 RepID=UPI0018DBEF49|nr:hypothetical protein [Acinetobacter calcoaceticus]
MWTRQELKEIRERAELEALKGNNEKWRHACLNLAFAADRLDAITNRVEMGEEVVKLQHPNEE